MTKREKNKNRLGGAVSSNDTSKTRLGGNSAAATVSVCLWPLRSPLPLLRIQFEAPGAYITCLCRGPLKPKLAAMRSAWSSRMPSNMSMTSCEIQRRGGDKQREGKRSELQEKAQGAQEGRQLRRQSLQSGKSHNKVVVGEHAGGGCVAERGDFQNVRLSNTLMSFPCHL